MGAFGDDIAVTPHLDQLAAEGVRFPNTFTTAGVCSPSRAALITGMHQQSIGAQHMRTRSFGRERTGPGGAFSTPGPPYDAVPPVHVKAFPELLRRAGYFTVVNVKKDYQFGEPFTIWDAVGPDTSWRDAPEGTPFFAMFSNMATHESRMFPEWRGRAERVVSPDQVRVPAYLPDHPEVRRDIAQHYDNIHKMDADTGALIDQLRADGLLDTTIIIWSADHGDGLPRAKRTVYDGGLQVPLIIRFPDGRYAGAMDETLVSFVDVAPTILALAGVDAPAHWQGRDLFGDGSERQYVFAARDRMDEHPDRVRAARDARFKYIRNDDPERPVMAPLAYRERLASMQAWREAAAAGTLSAEQEAFLITPRPLEELYDTAADPDEIPNLADDPAYGETLARMRAALDGFLARTGDLSAEENERAMVERIWPGLEQPVTATPAIALDADEAGWRVRLTAPDNASIGYRVLHDADAACWRLYTAPFPIPAGVTLEAKAIRYGYAESAVATGSTPSR